MGEILFNAAQLMFVLLLPFVVFAVVIHFLEHAIQLRLAERFGWRSVLWTGWLGTPIHELSHAAMCWVFQHRIDDIALFEPDLNSGRLGYVRHSYRRGSWFQEIGNVFIGVAPLIGGSVALTLLLWLFFPQSMSSAIEAAQDRNGSGGWGSLVNSVQAMSENLLTLTNLFSIRFWIFVYLVLCVGGHMAPSGSDYAGAFRGTVILAALLGGCAVVASLFNLQIDQALASLVTLLGPLFAVFALTVVLCLVATILVYLVTAPFPKRYRVQ